MLRHVGRSSLALWLAALCASVSAAQQADPADSPTQRDQRDQRQERSAEGERLGRLVRVNAPITNQTEKRIRRTVDRMLEETKFDSSAPEQWPVLVFEVEAGQSRFEYALALARYISSPQLSGMTTVAFLPESISGHAVLVALACDEIVMSPEAKIGDASAGDEMITPVERSGYVEIARESRSVPVAVALGMLDPAVEVVAAETEISREFVLGSDLDELKEQKAIGASEVLIPSGETGLFTGNEARELGFVRYLADDRTEVAKALGLPRDALEDDPSEGGDWRPIRVDVKGPITSRSIEQARTMIDAALRERDANFVCVWIDSPGGSPIDSYKLATYLADLNPGEVRTVAYIPSEARADAAFIALGCDHVVIKPSAIFGGPGAYEMTGDDVDSYAESIAELARRKGHSPALAAALVDPELVVFRYQRKADALVDYFTEEEFAERNDADEWRREQRVSDGDTALRLDGDEAVELGVAQHTVDDFREFKTIYGLQNDPTLVEPGWADFVIDALNSPWLAMTLLAIGGFALYFELQAPGIGIGAFTAGVCFLLYFWSKFLGGTADVLEIMLFLAGVACLVLEFFVLPGFGIFGIGGGALVISSLVLASQTFVLPSNEYQTAQLRTSLLVLVAAGAVVIATGSVMRRYMHRAPVLNRMMLRPPSDEEIEHISNREALASFEHLIGEHGSATTRISPAGKARIGDELLDVMSDGEIIGRGAEVVVIEARGNRVVVRALS